MGRGECRVGSSLASVAIVVGGVVDGGLSMGRFSWLSLVKKLYLKIVMSGRLLYVGVGFLAKRRSERSERSVFGNKYSHGHIYLFL